MCSIIKILSKKFRLEYFLSRCRFGAKWCQRLAANFVFANVYSYRKEKNGLSVKMWRVHCSTQTSSTTLTLQDGPLLLMLNQLSHQAGACLSINLSFMSKRRTTLLRSISTATSSFLPLNFLIPASSLPREMRATKFPLQISVFEFCIFDSTSPLGGSAGAYKD